MSRKVIYPLFRGAGFAQDDMQRPVIAIANSWTEVVVGQIHLRQVSEAIRGGIKEGNGVPPPEGVGAC